MFDLLDNPATLWGNSKEFARGELRISYAWVPEGRMALPANGATWALIVDDNLPDDREYAEGESCDNVLKLSPVLGFERYRQYVRRSERLPDGTRTEGAWEPQGHEWLPIILGTARVVEDVCDGDGACVGLVSNRLELADWLVAHPGFKLDARIQVSEYFK